MGLYTDFIVPVTPIARRSHNLKWGMSVAERCSLVTQRLRKNLTWAVGRNGVNNDYPSVSLKIKGNQDRGKLFVVHSKSTTGYVTVTVNGDQYDALRCRLKYRNKKARRNKRR